MTLTTARDLAARLAELLSRERTALADFLVALADFDRRRGWEELGYPNLFDFLVRELGMSRGTAFYRKVAVELVQRYPDVLEPLRDGRICITAVHTLSKAITPENRTEVLPRFFNLSKQQAKAVSAEIAPAPMVPRKDVVTLRAVPEHLDLGQMRQPVGAVGGEATRHEAPSPPSIEPPPPPVVQPLSATETRLHITVTPEFLKMLDACKKVLSHAIPGATAEDVLTAGMKLILAQDAKKKALTGTPRKAAPAPPARIGSRHVPAEIRRAVWLRDEGKCQWPVASGGICGSQHKTELDHVIPRGKGGPTSIDNLRVLCEAHNLLAARRAYGDDLIERCGGTAKHAFTGVSSHPSPARRSASKDHPKAAPGYSEVHQRTFSDVAPAA